MAVIVNSIGTTGRDYSTLQAWEDAVPADVVASGNSYVGECYNDSEFTAGVDFSAHTTDSTHTITLTAAAGQSFQDHASVRTNALTYDQSKGVGMVRIATTYANCVGLSGTTEYLTISRLQMRTTAINSAPLVNTASISTNLLVKDVILVSGNTGTAGVYEWVGRLVNALMIVTGTAGDGFYVLQSTHLIGCAAVRLTDNSPAGRAFVARNVSTPILQSSASFGFTTSAGADGSGTWSGASSKNNATDLASGLPGSANQHSVTFSSATPFTDADATGTDLKPIASTALASNGFLDATNAPNDITGTARSATPTIGVWELSGDATLTWLPQVRSQSGRTTVIPSGMMH